MRAPYLHEAPDHELLDTTESLIPRGSAESPIPQGLPGNVVATGLDLIVDRLDEAAAAEADANRAHARSWAALAEVMRLARSNPHLYLRPAGLDQKKRARTG